jgi:hypothetical protein
VFARLRIAKHFPSRFQRETHSLWEGVFFDVARGDERGVKLSAKGRQFDGVVLRMRVESKRKIAPFGEAGWFSEWETKANARLRLLGRGFVLYILQGEVNLIFGGRKCLISALFAARVQGREIPSAIPIERRKGFSDRIFKGSIFWRLTARKRRGMFASLASNRRRFRRLFKPVLAAKNAPHRVLDDGGRFF